MKTKFTAICATLALAGAVWTHAGEPAQPKTSAEFERMKTLVGSWTGKTDMGQGPVDLNIQYRLLAGGSVLEERCFAGTPNEMITMYFEKGGKLALTHYCVLGNRPGMVLGSSDDKSFKFEFDTACGVNVSKESHMHSLTIRFDDSDTITTSCKAVIEGKEVPEHATTLKRTKS